MVIGFDDNLGLPPDFGRTMSLETRSYHDLGEMLRDFEAKKFKLLFLPAGALPYLKGDYELIAQAALGSTRENQLRTKWVSAEKSVSPQVPLGIVNRYCTTSFWAPMILFKDRTSLVFTETNGFEDMLVKTSKKEIQSSMVWDVILKRFPEVAKKVHILDELSGLPTPLIIANESVSEALKKKLTTFASTNKDVLFGGFREVNLDGVETFKKQMNQAINQFHLKGFS